MSIAFPVTKNRVWFDWLVGLASLGVIQLLGVAVVLDLWRVKPKRRQTIAPQKGTELTERKCAAQPRLVTVIFEGSRADKSAIAISEIWRKGVNQRLR
jgi:hypothetical protein